MTTESPTTSLLPFLSDSGFLYGVIFQEADKLWSLRTLICLESGIAVSHPSFSFLVKQNKFFSL